MNNQELEEYLNKEVERLREACNEISGKIENQIHRQTLNKLINIRIDSLRKLRIQSEAEISKLQSKEFPDMKILKEKMEALNDRKITGYKEDFNGMVTDAQSSINKYAKEVGLGNQTVDLSLLKIT